MEEKQNSENKLNEENIKNSQKEENKNEQNNYSNINIQNTTEQQSHMFTKINERFKTKVISYYIIKISYFRMLQKLKDTILKIIIYKKNY